MTFQKAVRTRAKLRLLLDGPAKAGKTTTALRLATLLGGRIAVIDCEQGKSALCVGERWDGKECEFDITALADFSPMEYTLHIQRAAAAAYPVLVIDGLSPAWDGIGGALEMHDAAEEKNSFFAWKPVTKAHRRMLDAILNYPGHVIVTVRSQIAYVTDRNPKGQEVPRRIGLKPVQRAGIEYEFDLLASMDADHVCRITGARCQALDGLEGHKPGAVFWGPLLQWLDSGQVAVQEAPGIPLASDDQVAQIRQLWVDLGVVQRVGKAGLFRKYTVNEVHQLTKEQATSVLQDLKAQVAAKEKPSPDRTGTPAQPYTRGEREETLTGDGQTLQEALVEEQRNAAAAAATKHATDRDAALQRLVAARESYMCLVGLQDGTSEAGKAARKELWQKILAKRGVTTATSLDVSVINEMTERLERRVTELVEQQRAAAAAAAATGASPAMSPATGFQGVNK